MGSNRADALNDAIKKLAPYYGIRSKDEFFLAAISSDTAPGNTPSYEEIKEGTYIDPAEKVCELIGNLMDGGLYISEILKSPGGDVLADDKLKLQKTFLVVGGSSPTGENGESLGDNDPAMMSHNTISLLAMLPLSGLEVNKLSKPTKAEPTVGVIQVRPAALNFSSRDTGACDLFLNSIPPLEWTRAIPYFDLQIVTPQADQADDKDFTPGSGHILRFLEGRVGSPDPANPGYAMATAFPLNAEIPDEGSYAMFGMESFTSPQTLIPANEFHQSIDSTGVADNAIAAGTTGKPTDADIVVPARSGGIIDRMRPFMSVKKFDVSVKGTRGMMSTKQGKLNLVLHDRSRMADIADLIRPGAFGRNEILIEYGWSHPDGYINDTSTYSEFGKFLNAIRSREKYMVTNSTYSFTDDGQVDIELQLVTRGASQFNIYDIGISPDSIPKWEAIEEVIGVIKDLRSKIFPGKEMADVEGVSTVAAISPNNVGALLANGSDSLKSIVAFRKTLKKKSGGDFTALDRALGDLTGDLASFQKSLGEVIAAKIAELENGHDPFFMSRVIDQTLEGVSRSGTVYPAYDKPASILVPGIPKDDLRKKVRALRPDAVQVPEKPQMEIHEAQLAIKPLQAKIDAGQDKLALLYQYQYDIARMLTDAVNTAGDTLGSAAETQVTTALDKVEDAGGDFTYDYDSQYGDPNLDGDQSAHIDELLQTLGERLTLINEMGLMAQTGPEIFQASYTAGVEGAGPNQPDTTGDMAEFMAKANRSLDLGSAPGPGGGYAGVANAYADVMYGTSAGTERRNLLFPNSGLAFVDDEIGAALQPSPTEGQRSDIATLSKDQPVTDATAGQGLLGRLALVRKQIAEIKAEGVASLGLLETARQNSRREYAPMRRQLSQQIHAGGWNYASAAKILTAFVAMPLAATRKFNEVQLIFYCFNDQASWMWTQNIGSFPIPIDTDKVGFKQVMELWRKKLGNISVTNFLGFMNSKFFGSMAQPAYGFHKFYTYDPETGSTVVADQKKDKPYGAADLAEGRDATLAAAYAGQDKPLKFRRPSISVYVETVPHQNFKSATILRLHFYDRAASKYSGMNKLLGMAKNNAIGVMKGSLPEIQTGGPNEEDPTELDANQYATMVNETIAKAEKFKLIKVIKTPSEDDAGFVINGGPSALKYFIKTQMPSIIIGGACCAVTNATVGSNHNSMMGTISMMRQNRQPAANQPPGNEELGLPIRMSSMQVSLDTLGCPLLNFGQQFFIDFGTHTSIDDIYGVVGLNHTIEPGKFTSKVKMVKIDAYGSYESLAQQLAKARIFLSQQEIQDPE